MPRDQYEPRNGDRVQTRLSGRRGEIIRCVKKDRTGFYFRVKFDDGAWDWPNDVIAESSGLYQLFCRECSIEFRSDNIREVLCPNCERITITSRAEAADEEPSHGFGRRAWTRRHMRLDE